MKGDEVQHIPSISQSLGTIWETPKCKVTDGSANCTKKAKVTKKEPRKNISKQMAETNPRTKIPDSEIRIENIIQGSPSFVPYKIKVKTPKGLGKGNKDIKLSDSASEMAHTKQTKTIAQRREQLVKEEADRDRKKSLAARSSKLAKKAKDILKPKSKTTDDGKTPRKQLAMKAAYKNPPAGDGGGAPKKWLNLGLWHFLRVPIFVAFIAINRQLHQKTLPLSNGYTTLLVLICGGFNLAVFS